MKIQYKVTGHRVDVALIGELDTPATVQIQPEIDKLLLLEANEFVIDCSKLAYISSSGLRQLICIHKKCKANGGNMKLTNVNSDAMEIFAVTCFDRVFDIEAR